MRLTRRAAMRAEQAHADDETNDASNPHADIKERMILGEVSANTTLDPEPRDAPTKKMAAAEKKKGKAKGGAKKGAKGKKAKAVQEEEGIDEVEPVLEDERQAAASPASDAAVDELANEPTANAVQMPASDERPASPPSRAVRTTRRQLAKQEEDFSRSLRSRGPPQPDPIEDTTAAAQEPPTLESQEQFDEEAEEVPATEVHAETDAQGEAQVNVEAEEPATLPAEITEQETTTPAVEVTEPEPKTLTSEKPSEEESTPSTSLAPSRTMSRSSSRSPSRTPMRLEESFGAIDALEEALENVGGSIPSFDQLADEKSPRKAQFTRNTPPRKTGAKTSTTAKVSRNPAAPKSTKSNGLSRSSSVRAPPKERAGSGEVADYLASKRRPISMTFAAPPPPAKSTKAPTKSDFQLPGEKIAAELKAKREERLQRMAEEGPKKQRPISMPPPPKSTKPPTKSDFQLPGEKVAAELKAKREERLERMANGETTAPRPVSLAPPSKSTKPPTVPNFQLPGEKFAAEQKAHREERLKREAEEAEAAKAFKARPAPVRKPVHPPPVRQTASSQARERLMSKENINGPTIQPLQRSNSVTASKRSSVAGSRSVSNSSSNRNSVILPSAPVKLAPVDAAALKLKGKEVFNRDKLEKEAREKERREKEEAAKKARDEAAERGRIASREWARKQMERKEEAARRAKEAAAV